ncbi:hypothetical protein BDW60DRAFT_106156 [Aspergillus nidulans var. acristatus]
MRMKNRIWGYCLNERYAMRSWSQDGIRTVSYLSWKHRVGSAQKPTPTIDCRYRDLHGNCISGLGPSTTGLESEDTRDTRVHRSLSLIREQYSYSASFSSHSQNVFRVPPSPTLRSSLHECKQARKETSNCPICMLLKPLNEACSILRLSLSYLRLRAFVPALCGSSQQRQTRVRFPFCRAGDQP